MAADSHNAGSLGWCKHTVLSTRVSNTHDALLPEALQSCTSKELRRGDVHLSIRLTSDAYERKGFR